MTGGARYPISIRVLVDESLAEFAKDEARRTGTNVSTIARQALAARRDARRVEERQAAALHRQIESEVERTSSGVN